VILKESLVKVKDDNVFPTTEVYQYVIWCGFDGRDVFKVVVDGAEIDDKSDVVCC